MFRKLTVIGLLLCSLSICGCTRVEDIKEEEKKEEKKEEEKKEEKENTEEQDTKDYDELIKKLNAYIKEDDLDPELFSYCIEDLETGKIIKSDNAAQDWEAGSVYKLPLSMLWYDRIAVGSVDYYQGLYYSEACGEEDGGQIQVDFKVGDTIPLCTVLGYTLLYSDNVGGHILFESYGGWYAYKRDAANYSQHPQTDNFFSLTNYLNAQYMCDVMRRIYQNQDLYAEVIEYLRIASPDNYLNSQIQVDMVQKVGWYTDHVNSCGLSLNGHPYSICVFTRYNNYGLTVQGKLNEICYNFFNKE
ncbi:MAG: serine hydrolase [Holdemanella sp.]|nr:serine hydrolase [Holdemanella sp.]